jgi:hypothetical protein
MLPATQNLTDRRSEILQTTPIVHRSATVGRKRHSVRRTSSFSRPLSDLPLAFCKIAAWLQEAHLECTWYLLDQIDLVSPILDAERTACPPRRSGRSDPPSPGTGHRHSDGSGDALADRRGHPATGLYRWGVLAARHRSRSPRPLVVRVRQP